MAKQLWVFLFDHLIGTLQQHHGKLTFTYDPTWLEENHAQPLSCSLPLQNYPFDDAQCRPFFAGLLPEGELRQLLARQFQLSDGNSFGLLNEIGGECAGAVTFLEPGQTPRPASENAIHWLSESELVNILEDLPRRPMLAGDDGLRLSLAGAQDKLPVVVEDERIGLAMNGTPSTHILKSAISTLDGSVGNEHFCLQLAAKLRFNTATSIIRSAGQHTFLLVERYDRTHGASATASRIHQEDFCQALGRPSDAKYQHEGGPDLTDCFKLIRDRTRPAAPSVIQFLDAVIFNALIGNHDAHAKNFSVLYTKDRPKLAPLYDILSTAVYTELTDKMAMKIASQYTFKGLMPRHWEQLAEHNGLSVPQTLKRVATIAKQLPDSAQQLYKSSANEEFLHFPIIEKIIELITNRCEMTLRRLAK